MTTSDQMAGMSSEIAVEESPLSLPMGRFPTGWFQVGWSDELPPGACKPLRYFNQDIVLWRSASGKLNALDAFCLHLGANLGVNGSVCGEDIKCPWHGWQWNGEGHNTLIPYSVQERKEHLRIKVWQVRERYGCILIWHDGLDRDPLWDPPVIDELERSDLYPITSDMRVLHRIKAHPQMVMENGADALHVVFVHGAGEVPEILSFDFEDHRFKAQLAMTYGAGKESTWLTPDGPRRGVVTYGMCGISQAWVTWPPEILGLTQFGGLTPIDEHYGDYYNSFTVRRRPGDPEDCPSPGARKIISHQFKVIEEDFFTWANMKVLQVPNFAPEEAKHYAAFRRWAWQFYPDSR